MIVCGLVFLSFLPVASQGYYNEQSGINNVWGQTTPPGYAQLQVELKSLVGDSYAGVAYFNPDLNLFFNNTEQWFVNPLVVFPNVRTLGLTYYGAPNTQTNRYFAWVSQLFYLNETKYLSES